MEAVLTTCAMAAKALNLSPRIINHMVFRGQLRAIGSGSGRRVLIASIQEWQRWLQPHDETVEANGFVYLMRYGYYYKIGLSKNVERRLHDLQTLVPGELSLVHKVPTNQMIVVEQMLHRWFDAVRVRGEWFRLRSFDVQVICACKSFIINREASQ